MKLYKHNLIQQLGFPSGIDTDKDIVVMIRSTVDAQSLILHYSLLSGQPSIYYLPYDTCVKFESGIYTFLVE